jgi:hypothetical protein
MEIQYRIMLRAEDGVSCLRDGYSSISKAEFVLDRLSECYGEGQTLYIEQYKIGPARF